MATHNQVRAVGFLKNDPKVLNEGVEGAEKVLFMIRTLHRDIDGFHGMKFQDLMVYYDGTELMQRMKALSKFDLIDIKGVFNILSLSKNSMCPGCGRLNTKLNGTSTFIYPISMTKLNAMREAYEHDEGLPERILETHFKEVSNQVLLIGTVVNEPELLQVKKTLCCRYRLGVDRKYYIKSQGDLTADYPWVYSYAQQAERDYEHLRPGALILVDGFIQNRQVKSKMLCSQCGAEYFYDDAATEMIPYAVEYLMGHLTDEEIALTAGYKAGKELREAENAIFG